MTAALAQATGMVLSRQGIGNFDAVAATLIRVLGALPGYLVFVTVLRRWPSIFAAVRQTRAMAIVFTGSLIGPLLGVVLCMIALRHCPAGVVTTIVSTATAMKTRRSAAPTSPAVAPTPISTKENSPTCARSRPQPQERRQPQQVRDGNLLRIEGQHQDRQAEQDEQLRLGGEDSRRRGRRAG